MKVHFDSAKCVGHAQCFATGPDFYLLDEDTGYCSLPEVTEVPENLKDQAAKGANACPEGALSILP